MVDRERIEGCNEVEMHLCQRQKVDFLRNCKKQVKQMSDMSRLGSCCRGPAMINCQPNKLSVDTLNGADVQLQVREGFQGYRLGLMGNLSKRPQPVCLLLHG